MNKEGETHRLKYIKVISHDDESWTMSDLTRRLKRTAQIHEAMPHSDPQLNRDDTRSIQVKRIRALGKSHMGHRRNRGDP